MAKWWNALLTVGLVASTGFLATWNYQLRETNVRQQEAIHGLEEQSRAVADVRDKVESDLQKAFAAAASGILARGNQIDQLEDRIRNLEGPFRRSVLDANISDLEASIADLEGSLEQLRSCVNRNTHSARLSPTGSQRSYYTC